MGIPYKMTQSTDSFCMNAVALCWKSIWLYVTLLSELIQIADVQHPMSMFTMPQMSQMPFSYFGQSSMNGAPMSNMMQFSQTMMQQPSVQRAPQESQRVTQQRQNTRSQQKYNRIPDNVRVSQPGRSDQQQPSRRSPPATGGAVSFPMMSPMPVPFPIAPVQYALPGLPLPQFCARKPRPPNCPPCPPCTCVPCMPAFFAYCSPCHIKCRCKGGQSVPVPLPPFPPIPIPGQMSALPMAMPGANFPFNPAQVMMVPFPQFGLPATTRAPNSIEDCDDEDSQGTRSVKPKKRVKALRDGGAYSEDSDNELLVPVLSYVGQNGKVKFKTPISDSEASELLENGREFGDDDMISRRALNDGANDNVEETSNKTPETVHVMARSNAQSGSELQVLTERDVKKRVWLHEGDRQYTVQKGTKSLVFSPTGDKKIANLSVTFQVI